MTREASRSRLWPAASLAVALAVTASGVSACLVVEPPGDLPTTPVRRPTIRRSEASPVASFVLGAWPESFLVPVELVDASQTFQWRVFVDYDPEDRRVEPAVFGASAPNLADRNGNVRLVRATVPAPTDNGRCHVIEFLVAARFLGDLEGRTAHTPAAPGGDSIVWFYSPGGDLSGCPVYSAAIDAGTDASDAGTGGDGTP
jgi:hypothetical protein